MEDGVVILPSLYTLDKKGNLIASGKVGITMIIMKSVLLGVEGLVGTDKPDHASIPALSIIRKELNHPLIFLICIINCDVCGQVFIKEPQGQVFVLGFDGTLVMDTSACGVQHLVQQIKEQSIICIYFWVLLQRLIYVWLIFIFLFMFLLENGEPYNELGIHVSIITGRVVLFIFRDKAFPAQNR